MSDAMVDGRQRRTYYDVFRRIATWDAVCLLVQGCLVLFIDSCAQVSRYLTTKYGVLLHTQYCSVRTNSVADKVTDNI